jgi:hypothetical protein
VDIVMGFAIDERSWWDLLKAEMIVVVVAAAIP